MGRSMPVECAHGTTIDWGDFGPCQGSCDEVHPDDLDNCPDSPGCPTCEGERHPCGFSAQLVDELAAKGWKLVPLGPTEGVEQ